MGILTWLRIGSVVRRQLREMDRQEVALRVLPMPELVAVLANAMGIERIPAPASAAAIAAWESSWGVQLPEEVRAFYQVADGLPPGEHGWPRVNALADLVPASHQQPAFSAQLLEDWSLDGEQEGEPCGLKLMAPGLMNLALDRSERLLPFSDTDRMLVLCADSAATQAVLIVTEPHDHLPRGTVLDIESLVATRYDNLSDWLAHLGGLLHGIDSIQTLGRD